MNTILFSHARTALKFGLLSSIEKKNSYILVPDYICEVVPNTILLNNYKLIYYRIKFKSINQEFIHPVCRMVVILAIISHVI